jgi:uncharacterized protein (TIGR03437 family)
MRAVAILMILGAWAAWAQTSDDFFDDKVLHEIRLEIRAADWATLRQHYQENTYYPADFEWRGIKVFSVGVRSRGTGSRSPIKPGIRVDFNRYDENQQFLGLNAVELKNMAQDASMLRDRVVMASFRRMGLVASRYAHARLYINGQYAGVYAMVESIDKPFLKHNFGENDGYLYENKWTGEPYYFQWPIPTPPPFEAKTHESDPNNLKPLEDMIHTMNQASDADFPRAMAEYLDLKLFMMHVGVENSLADLDGVVGDSGARNFYLYQFERKKLFQFIVWDKDQCFSDAQRDILLNVDKIVLMRRAMAVPELRAAYLEALLKSAAWAGGADGWLEQELVRQYSQIREAARADPVKQCPSELFGPMHTCSNEEFENEVIRVRNFLHQRDEIVRRQVAAAGYEFRDTAPKLSAGGAVNAASYVAVISPGSLASLYGPLLGNSTALASSLPLPTSLDGLSILINGFPAPLVFISPQQVNLQVPWEIAPGTVPIAATLNGVLGGTITATAGAASPGIFAITYADGSLVSAERPIAASDVLVIYATGLGPVTRTVSTGQASPVDPLANTTEVPSVTIGGVPAQVVFSGLAPGFVGTYQVNVVAPGGVATGPKTPLIVTIAGEASPPLPVPTR